MKHRILPGAAGLIALTATIGFMDGYRDLEIENYSRNSISLVSVHLDGEVDFVPLNNQQDKKIDQRAYLVEIRRGSLSTEVKIDARTGRIIFT
jgi:hypothetical protein